MSLLHEGHRAINGRSNGFRPAAATATPSRTTSPQSALMVGVSIASLAALHKQPAKVRAAHAAGLTKGTVKLDWTVANAAAACRVNHVYVCAERNGTGKSRRKALDFARLSQAECVQFLDFIFKTNAGMLEAAIDRATAPASN